MILIAGGPCHDCGRSFCDAWMDAEPPICRDCFEKRGALLDAAAQANPIVTVRLAWTAAHTILGALHVALLHPDLPPHFAQQIGAVCDALPGILSGGDEAVAQTLRLGDPRQSGV